MVISVLSDMVDERFCLTKRYVVFGVMLCSVLKKKVEQYSAEECTVEGVVYCEHEERM